MPSEASEQRLGFSDLVSSGKIGKDFQANNKQWERARAERAEAEEKKSE